MKNRHFGALLVAGVLCAAILAPGAPAPAAAPPLGLPPVPVPEDNPQTPAKIELGDKLFHDKRFSSTGERLRVRTPSDSDRCACVR